jgi:hypothetical protein
VANNNTYYMLDSYWEKMAFDLVLIDTLSGSSGTKYNSSFKNIDLQQRSTVETKGSIGEYYIGFGANYNHNLYLGASLNIRSGYYTDLYTHKEVDITNAISDASYSFSHNLYSWVRGWNAKFGAIYRPFETLRIGVSLHTPTIVDIEQEWSTGMSVTDDNNVATNARPTDSEGYDIGRATDRYTVTSPMRVIAGVAYMFQDKGLVSFDYEYVDYSKIQFSNGDFQDNILTANDESKKFMVATHNFRTGAELKLNSFYVRGGFAYYASPYASGELNNGANTFIYSTGLGYRTNGFSLDLGYSLLTKTEKYMLYNDVNLQPATLDTKTGTFLLTAGFRF